MPILAQNFKKMTEKGRQKLSILLKRLASGIEKGECDCDELIFDVVKEIIKDDYTRTEAARYIGISERTFDRYRKEGIVGQGRKKAGGLTLWRRKQLDNCIKRLQEKVV